MVAGGGDGEPDQDCRSTRSVSPTWGRRRGRCWPAWQRGWTSAATSTGPSWTNLRKAVRYYLAVKVALVTVSFAAAVSGLPLPFAPVQIVILELFMDLCASVAFVSLPPEADEMRRPPREPTASFMDHALVAGIAAGGLTLAVATAAMFLLVLRSAGVDGSRTMAVVTWMLSHAVLGLVMGRERRPVSLQGLRRTPAMLVWVGASLVFAVAMLAVPALRDVRRGGPVSWRVVGIAAFRGWAERVAEVPHTADDPTHAAVPDGDEVGPQPDSALGSTSG